MAGIILSEYLDEEAVMTLAAAIQSGDLNRARCALDRLIEDDDVLLEWAERGRRAPQAAFS